MKKILFSILVILPLFLQAQTNYYIDPAGTDDAGRNGSISQPWLTLSYAVTRVTTPGDTIHVNEGEYSVGMVRIPTGVSIVGEGTTKSKFLSTYTTDTDARLGSLVFGGYGLTYDGDTTDGNQVIRNIWIDGMNGGDTAYIAISIVGRSNIRIHHSKVTNFKKGGISFWGPYGDTSSYVMFGRANKVYNDTILNCGSYRYALNGADGALTFGGQKNMEIYNNYIRQNYRTDIWNGYPIKAVRGYNKGFKIYNNTLICYPKVYKSGTPHQPIAIECFNGMGGNQIYNNTMINAGVDLAGPFNLALLYTYSYWIHNNYIYMESQATTSGTMSTAIVLESGVVPPSIHAYDTTVVINKVIIEKNYIKDFGYGIQITQKHPGRFKDIRIRYNIIHNNGNSGANYGWGIGLSADSTWWRNYGIDYTARCDYVYIDNNVIWDDKVSYDPQYGIAIYSNGTYHDIYVRNNISMNAMYSWFRTKWKTTVAGKQNPTIDRLFLQNNVQYGNGYNYPMYQNQTGPPLVTDAIVATNVTYADSVIADPLFVNAGTNFDIQNTSPAVNAGIDVGLTTDYVDSTIVGLPDIGAYEYYADVPAIDPIVETVISPYYRTHNSAVGKGNVTSNGGGTILARGICWSTSANPTISDSHTHDGTGTGAFTSRITGLKAFTKYYFRAYATNEAGTAYGENKTIKTSIMITR